jgi:hypothetical protein
MKRRQHVPEFLKLSKDERQAILSEGGARMGRLPNVLEKDVWVCWVLDRLFRMPGALQMAFKGGTSLSKVYGAIARFSEDIDVTIDYRALTDIDPFGLSNNKKAQLCKELQERVAKHIASVVYPYFKTELDQEFGKGTAPLEIQGDVANQLVIRYPSALDGGGGYVVDAVRIEFGGRNITDPQSRRNIIADLANVFPDLELPKAEAAVLHLERTLWEKATLIHVECSREPRENADRLCRHWYDLDRLYVLDAGQEALKHHGLLEDVVKHKAVFFPTKFYENCLNGKLQLVPEGGLRKQLEADYGQMVGAGMFYTAPPKFDEILGRLSEMQSTINKARSTRPA